MLLYNAELSHNKTGIFVGASYEAVREWYQKGKELFKQSIERKRRKRIAIDEKEIRINHIETMIFLKKSDMSGKVGYRGYSYMVESVYLCS